MLGPAPPGYRAIDDSLIPKPTWRNLKATARRSPGVIHAFYSICNQQYLVRMLNGLVYYFKENECIISRTRIQLPECSKKYPSLKRSEIRALLPCWAGTIGHPHLDSSHDMDIVGHINYELTPLGARLLDQVRSQNAVAEASTAEPPTDQFSAEPCKGVSVLLGHDSRCHIMPHVLQSTRTDWINDMMIKTASLLRVMEIVPESVIRWPEKSCVDQSLSNISR